MAKAFSVAICGQTGKTGGARIMFLILKSPLPPPRAAFSYTDGRKVSHSPLAMVTETSRLGDLHSERLFLTVLEAGKTQIEVPVDGVCHESRLRSQPPGAPGSLLSRL